MESDPGGDLFGPNRARLSLEETRGALVALKKRIGGPALGARINAELDRMAASGLCDYVSDPLVKAMHEELDRMAEG